MDLDRQKKAFYQLVSPSYPNEWEVDEALEILAQVDNLQRQSLLAYVPAIWPISHSLCFSYLSEGIRGLRFFSSELLAEWVRQILASYEEGGLRSAREFMADIDRNFLDPLRGRAGVSFQEIVGRLQPYICGVSGLHLDLNVASNGWPWTDTRTINVPDTLNIFPERKKNQLLYKFIITIQWGYIAAGTYLQEPGEEEFTELSKRYRSSGREKGLEAYFSLYPDPELAELVFHIIEFERVFAMIAQNLPGLVRQARPLCLELLLRQPGEVSAREEKIRGMLKGIILNTGALLPEKESRLAPSRGTFPRIPGLFDDLSKYPGAVTGGWLKLLLGQLNFSAAQKAIDQRRAEDKEMFIALLAAALDRGKQAEQKRETSSPAHVGGAEIADALVLVPPTQLQVDQDSEQRKILVNNEEMLLPEELSRVLGRVEAEMGTVPDSYIQAAVGMAGQGRNWSGAAGRESGTNLPGGDIILDEWDYRRSGYRKSWCTLYVKELPQTVSNFVPVTLQKHRGLITRMKRQFEMLRTTERFAKHRRYGDDLDFDAIVDALGDQSAGIAPSDRLFIRLLHDERDIATLFLVDMSNSTEGWIGNLIKESLVILGEMMEVVGDRYGIYGFSGMRRSRCELFHIKHLDEHYGDAIRQRIAAITPREYTRMGPPLRYLTKILLNTDARLRLLITLTDGKPEDYDGYNDEYAIEDTRKALVEARGEGIHPFCVNIDQRASGYLQHMYGRGKYVFINKIESLPEKMAEFYRVLTR